LRAAGIQVTILEKSRGVGGRMATRRIGNAVFDHGAQFLAGSSPEIRALIDEWERAGLTVLWSHGFPDRKGELPPLFSPRYRGSTGMTAIPKFLASGLDVRLEHRVTTVAACEGRWRVGIEERAELTADALVITAPLPQAVEILRSDPSAADPDTLEQLSGIVYSPSLALLILLDGPSAIGSPGGIHMDGEPVRWIADNFRKGISPVQGAVTVHAGPGFSRDHYHDPEERIVNTLLVAVRDQLAAPVNSVQLHRWRYSEPLDSHPLDSLVVRTTPPLILAGDAFGGPTISGAARSGLAAAQSLLTILG
jgi:hypothetical protein